MWIVCCVHTQEQLLGQTQVMSHTGPTPEWNERITYAPEDCVPGENVFRVRLGNKSSSHVLASLCRFRALPRCCYYY